MLPGEGHPWGWVLPGPSAAPRHCPSGGQGPSAALSAVKVLVGALWQLWPGRRRRGKGEGMFQAALAFASGSSECQRKRLPHSKTHPLLLHGSS